MPEVKGIEKLFSIAPRNRFSKPRLFGTAQFGFSSYGDEDLYFIKTPYGAFSYGSSEFGNAILLSGIYRKAKYSGKIKYYRDPFCITKNPRTLTQQINRQKYAAAVLAYQGLTSSEKLLYYERAIGKRFTGYNLFLKEYLLSH